jgi:hypothetical protein
VVEVGHKHGIIRKDGTWVLKPTYPHLLSLSNSRAVFSDKPGGKYGFLDNTGNVIIQPQFDRVWTFENGLAMVEVQGRFGYINRDGEYVWKPTK